MAKAGTFITGFMIGSLACGAVALIFAPRSGKELRSQVRDQAIRVQERARYFRDTGLDKVQETLDMGRQAINRSRRQMSDVSQPNQHSSEHTG